MEVEETYGDEKSVGGGSRRWVVDTAQVESEVGSATGGTASGGRRDGGEISLGER